MTLFDSEFEDTLERKYGQYVSNQWAKVLTNEAQEALSIVTPRMLDLYLDKSKTVYPEINEVFRIFDNCKLEDIKVVILGQDPYYNGNANGYAFGCKQNVSASLLHILRSIRKNAGKEILTQVHPESGPSLHYLVKQGVFLLNTILTVEAGKSESHSNIGWQRFTKEIIKIISYKCDNVVFMLWGNYAKSYAPIINDNKHLVLEWTHPASAARNNTEWNCPHFVTANKWLEEKHQKPIIWY